MYIITKPLHNKLNLLEEEAVLECSEEKRIFQLCRTLVIEEGDMP